MKKYLFAAVCGALFMTSCSNDEELAGAKATSRNIEFNCPFVEVATRAAITKDNFTEQEAAVKVWRGTDLQATLDLSYAGGKWNTSIQTPWYENQTYNFHAVMPKTVENWSADGTTIAKLPASVSLADGVDVMYANTPNVASAKGMADGVSLTFKHIYDKVSFKFAEPTGDYKVRITAANVWFPNKSVTWKYQEGVTEGYTATYTTKQEDKFAIEQAYTATSIGSGMAGEMATSAEQLLFVPNQGENKNVYLYADIKFQVEDNEGNVIQTRTIEKAPVQFSGELYGTGNKAITVNVCFDTSGKNGDGTGGGSDDLGSAAQVTNISFSVDYTDWAKEAYDYDWSTGNKK